MIYRHLPHLDIAGYYQFITFRTNDSTDGFLKKISLQNKPNSRKQLEVDKYLDSSKQGAYLYNNILIALSDFFKRQDKILYELIAFNIMPNHAHLLVKPLSRLPVVMQKIKGISANMINEVMGRKGKFWAADYYDKAIRDEKHFGIVYQYIKNNSLNLKEPKDSFPRFYGVFDDGELYTQDHFKESGTEVPLPNR